MDFPVEKSIPQTVETFRKIRNVFRNNSKSGLSYVLYPKTNDQGDEIKDQNGKTMYEACHDLEDIETILIKRNLNHFGQAHGSPPTSDLITQLIGDGCNNFSQQVINGQYVDTTTIPQQGLRQLLQSLKRKLPTSIDCTITVEELSKGFHNWRESTTTSPSGIDLGHWRATTHIIKTNEEHNQKSSDILRWHTILLNETIRREYVLNRWKTVHSCMIEKVPGYPLISKLRVIHIFEADLNLILGIWSRKLQWHAEDHKLLHRDQWAQKGNRAIDAAMTKKLTYIYSTLTRTDLGTLDTDAKSCYDRMVPNLVNLRNIQLGMPLSAAKIQSNFLNNATYYLKTRLGISKQSYGNTPSTPQYGQGQGAKWAPMSWIGISTLLLDVISQTVPFNMTIKDTTRRLQDTRQMDGYVDDFTSWTNLPNQLESDPHCNNNLSATNITSQLKQLSQAWEHLLACTGGRLELSKCFTYILTWCFDKKARAYLQPLSTSRITLRDTINEEELTIEQKDPNTPHRTLGIFISPTENQDSSIYELTTKCNKFATLLRASGSSLSKEDLRTFMSALYKPSITYMLPATSLTKSQCQTIQSNFVRAMAVSMGFNRNYPAILLHAPAYLGGVNIPDIYCEQGICHITFLLRHIRGQTRVGKLLLMILDWAQTYCGISQNILENVEIPIHKYMPVKWINSIRKFLQENNLHIKFRNSPKIPSRRAHDKCIMDIALNQDFSPSELLDINNCRLYLQVETLADISTACGKFLQSSATAKLPPTGTVSKFFSSVSTKLFPRQGIPSATTWKTWLKLMKISTGEFRSALERQLGDWNTKGSRERLWNSYIRPNHNDLITKHRKDKWEQVPIQDNKRTARVYDITATTTFIVNSQQHVHETWIPVDILSTDLHCVVTSQTQQSIMLNDTSEIPEDEQRFLALQNTVYAQNLIQIIKTEKHIEVTATSIGDCHNGEFCSIIASPTNQVTIQLEGKAHGHPMTAKREELFGIATVITTINNAIDKFKNNQEPKRLQSVSIYVNHQRNYRTLREWPYVKTTNLHLPDWDVSEYIHQKIIESPLNITVNKLPSKKIATRQLDLLQQSIDAVQHRKQSNSNKIPRPIHYDTLNEPLTTTTINLCTNRTYVCAGDEEKEIRRCVNEHAYISYLQDNKNMHPSTIQNIAWSERHIAMKSLPQYITSFIGKLAHGWLPTAQRLYDIGDSSNPICPRCGGTNETSNHVFTCHTALPWKEQSSAILRTVLISDRNPAEANNFREKIVHSFNKWTQLDNSDSENDDHPSTSLPDNINWLHCMCGMFPSQWITEGHLSRQEITQMARTLIETAYSGWKLRCDQTHEENHPDQRTESLRDLMIKEKARRLYNKGQELNIQHRQYFDFDIEQFLIGKSYRETNNWCNHTKRYIRDALAQERKNNKRHGLHQRTMSQYLNPAPDKYPP